MPRNLLIAVVATVAILVAVFIMIAMISPDYREAPAVSVSNDEDVIARGDYLANHVLGCVECHSERDWTKYGGPTVPPLAAGGPCLSEKDGLPGYVCMANITADRDTGLGKWTDGEIYRAIREGVDDRHKALSTLMPYEAYRQLSDEDTLAVVAYLRTLPAHEKFVPRAFHRFPADILLDFRPQPLEEPVIAPKINDTLAYGAYLVAVAGCETCHSPVDFWDHPDESLLFTGGQRFRGPWGDVVSTNLTPHETGLKDMSKESFIAMFKAFANSQLATLPIQNGRNTVMPWLSFAGMSTDDLSAIYSYLMTLKPIASDHSNPFKTSEIIEKTAQTVTSASEEPSAAETTPDPAAPTSQDLEEGGTDLEAGDEVEDY